MDPTPDYTALIVALTTLVTTIITGIIAIIAALRAGKASTGVEVVKTDVRKIELATNSMKDALVRATASENLAVGMAAGIAQERANPQSPSSNTGNPVKVEVANSDPVKVEVTKKV